MSLLACSHHHRVCIPCRKLKWGIKLKLDVNKAVVGLAAHPTSSQLMVLYEDGALRGYVMASSGLQSAWGASYFLPGGADCRLCVLRSVADNLST
jgi:hypothetical protein